MVSRDRDLGRGGIARNCSVVVAHTAEVIVVAVGFEVGVVGVVEVVDSGNMPDELN